MKRYIKPFSLYESENIINEDKVYDVPEFGHLSVSGKKLKVEFYNLDDWDSSMYGGGTGHRQAMEDIKLAAKGDNDPLLDTIEKHLETSGLGNINWDKPAKLTDGGSTIEFVLESLVTEADNNAGLYYEVAKKVLKKNRIKVHPARIDSLLNKLNADGFLAYDQMSMKDAEKDILSAIEASGNDIEIYINEDERVDEGFIAIAGGIIMAVLGLKILKAIAKGVLRGIGMNIKVSPEKLKDVVSKIQTETLKSGGLQGSDILAMTAWTRELNQKIDSGQITTLKQIRDDIDATSKAFE